MLEEAVARPDGQDSDRPRARGQGAAAEPRLGATNPTLGRTPLQGLLRHQHHQSTSRNNKL